MRDIEQLKKDVKNINAYNTRKDREVAQGKLKTQVRAIQPRWSEERIDAYIRGRQ